MYSYGPLHVAKQKQCHQLEPTYSSSVRIRSVTWRTSRKRRTIGRGGEKGSGISVMAAWEDDDEATEWLIWITGLAAQVIYIYIYIYIDVYIYIRKNKTGHIRIMNLFPSCYGFLKKPYHVYVLFNEGVTELIGTKI